MRAALRRLPLWWVAGGHAAECCPAPGALLQAAWAGLLPAVPSQNLAAAPYATKLPASGRQGSRPKQQQQQQHRLGGGDKGESSAAREAIYSRSSRSGSDEPRSRGIASNGGSRPPPQRVDATNNAVMTAVRTATNFNALASAVRQHAGRMQLRHAYAALLMLPKLDPAAALSGSAGLGAPPPPPERSAAPQAAASDMQARRRMVLDVIAPIITEALPTLDISRLVKVLWGMVRVEPGHALTQAALGELRRDLNARVAQCNPHDVAQLLYCLARLQLEGGGQHPLVRAALGRAGPLLHQADPHSLAHIAWACSTLQHAEPAFLAALAAASRPKLDHFDAPGLSMLMEALARLGHYDTQLYRAALHAYLAAAAKHGSFRATPVLWACARMGHQDQDAYEALANVVLTRWDSLDASRLADAFCGLAELGQYHPQLFSQGASRLVERMGRPEGLGQPQAAAHALAVITWAYARVGHQDGALLAATSRLLPRLPLHSLRLAPLINWLWALAVLEQTDVQALSALVSELARRHAAQPELLVTSSYKLYTALVELRDVLPAGSLPPSEPLWAALRARHCAERVSPTRSELQNKVMLRIAQLGLRPQAEQPDPTGLLSVDICFLSPSGQRVAVEVDGPQHFLAHPPSRPTGATLLRNRLLARRFDVLACVPWQEFGALEADLPAQLGYMRQLLSDAGVRGLAAAAMRAGMAAAAPAAGSPQQRRRLPAAASSSRHA